jgi:hypothetical protein
MQEGCYAVEHFKSQWVVSVGGASILTCKTKRMALRAARRATVLLQQDQEAEMSCHGGLARGGGSSPMNRMTVALQRIA